MSSQSLVGDAGLSNEAGTYVEHAHAHERSFAMRWVRRGLGAALLGLAIGLAIGRRHELAKAIDMLGHLRWQGLLVAVVLEAASLVAFARLQRWLLHEGGVDVGLVPMVQITLAGNALAMSLPGGAAWAAAWAFGQLRRRGADRVLAGWVVLVAGALASYALFMLLVVGSIVAGSKGPVAPARPLLFALASIPFLVVTGVIAAQYFPTVRKLGPASQRVLEALPKGEQMNALITRTWERLLTVRPSRGAWFEAFGLAALNWIENCGCLVACIWAVHGSIPWHGILVAYALAQVSASIPITPGGLGVVEGSLTAVLVAYGMPTDVALASVLLYRAVSFWGLVPVGWGVWGYLSLKSRPSTRTRKVRPHPWAVHLHRSSRAEAPPPKSAPDIVLPAEPCVGCEHDPDELVSVSEGTSQ